MISNAYFLQALDTTTYCRISVSKVHGIGVRAIRDIPKGIDPFISFGSNKSFLRLTEEEIKTLNPAVQNYIKAYYVRTEGIYPVMLRGLNEVGIFSYMNHSDNPNMALYKENENELLPFVSLKDIKAGEELFWDYRTSGGDNLEKQYPFLK